MLESRFIQVDDKDLAQIAEAFKDEDWEAGQYQSSLAAGRLKAFLEDPKTSYLVGYLGGVPAGRIFAYKLTHPSGSQTLFIDEVDVKTAFRRRGVALYLLRQMLDYAKSQDIAEVWLGAEEDNEAAKNLYRRIPGYVEENSPMFTYRIK